MIHWVKSGQELSIQLTQKRDYAFIYYLKRTIQASSPTQTYFTHNSNKPVTLTAFQNQMTRENAFLRSSLRHQEEVNTDTFAHGKK